MYNRSIERDRKPRGNPPRRNDGRKETKMKINKFGLVQMVQEYHESAEAYNKTLNSRPTLEGYMKDGEIDWSTYTDAKHAWKIDINGDYERLKATRYMLNIACNTMGLDIEKVESTIKAINRWEKHGGKYDRTVYSWSLIGWNETVDTEIFEDKSDKWYTSTGREKRYWEG